MNQDKLHTLDLVLEGLMRRYKERVPIYGTVMAEMYQAEMYSGLSDIENDHIAFRTMGVPHLGIQSLEKIFLHYGYTKMDHYHFAEKKLDAYWYSPPQEKYPRIFMSELRVEELSPKAREIIHRYTDSIKADPVDSLDLDNAEEVDRFLHTGLWKTPTLSDYETLLEESEYAAWVIYNHYYLNHFTIALHSLPNKYYWDIEHFVDYLQKQGIALNSSGAVIKQSPDGLLKQCSTVASKVMAEFQGGEKREIAGSYVEFAKREILPEFKDLPLEEVKRKHRREGFETGNADKIFESTYRAQTDKK